jgi:translation elongation factor EF-Ts
MKPSLAQVKEVRERTGLGLNEVVRAFQQVDDPGNIYTFLKHRGTEILDKRQARLANVCTVHSYVHNGRIGAMAKFRCETDFVARSVEYKAFMHNICMHVAACPLPSHVDLGFDEAFLKQPFVKDATLTIKDVIGNISAQTGEKVEITKVVRLDSSVL